MKKPKPDISTAITSLVDEMGRMRLSMDEMSATIAQQSRTIEGQQVEMRKLRKAIEAKDARITELEERLSKYEKPDKDSSNSSTPPSQESIKSKVARRTRSLREKSGRPVGGQHGHEGTTLMKTDTPDEVVSHQSNFCEHCGADLSGITPILDYVSQEIDVPPIAPHITEHRHYMKVCTCGHCNRGYAKRGRGGSAITYGKNIKAIIVYLSVVQCVPYERLQQLLEAVFGLHMSQGTVNNILQEANRKSKPAIELIKKAIMNSAIVGFDESGCFCNKRLDWSWIAQTLYYTLVFRGSGRAGAELEKVFGDSLKNMIAVTDRHSAYFALEFLGHQVCLAHLLRELEYLSELDESQVWSKDVAQLLRDAIKERNQDMSVVIDKEPWLQKLDRLLQQSVAHLKDDFTRLKNGLIKCRDHLFNFLSNPAIPPTNNDSERGIRKLKVKQKISGTFRSADGADVFHKIHSIVDTARKNGQPQLEAILALL